MPWSLHDLEKLAHALTAEERAKLAESLLASLQAPPLAEIETRWNREIEARVAAYDRGEGRVYDAADVFAEARSLVR